MLLIQRLAERQDKEIRCQRDNVERFRSIFGRLTVFIREGGAEHKGYDGHWVSTEALMEILTAVEMIIGPSKPDIPFGINRLNNGPVPQIFIDGPAIPQALDL